MSDYLQLNSVVKAVASALELVFTALLSVPILGNSDYILPSHYINFKYFVSDGST